MCVQVLVEAKGQPWCQLLAFAKKKKKNPTKLNKT